MLRINKFRLLYYVIHFCDDREPYWYGMVVKMNYVIDAIT